MDARSDIFSFGLVLYEMLSGRRAFARNSFIETMPAILHEEPAALDAPSHISEIVMRCLRKSSKDRFQTASDVRLTALRRTSPSIRAIIFKKHWGETGGTLTSKDKEIRVRMGKFILMCPLAAQPR